MNRKELDEEIEYIHSNRLSKKLLRPFGKMWNAIIEASNTYTNLSAFMSDYDMLRANGLIGEAMFNSAMNDLYLLALLHTSTDEYRHKLLI